MKAVWRIVHKWPASLGEECQLEMMNGTMIDEIGVMMPGIGGFLETIPRMRV